MSTRSSRGTRSKWGHSTCYALRLPDFSQWQANVASDLQRLAVVALEILAVARLEGDALTGVLQPVVEHTGDSVRAVLRRDPSRSRSIRSMAMVGITLRSDAAEIDAGEAVICRDELKRAPAGSTS